MTQKLVHLLCIMFFATTLLVEARAAQLPTIPESLEAAGKSLVGAYSSPSGPAPTVQEILAQTDVVVRGLAGSPRSYMAQDQRSVYTDYEIKNPTILYQRTTPVQAKPGPSRPIIVTFKGGTVSVGSLQYTEVHEAMPLPSVNTEYLLLLKQASSDGKFSIAGDYYGAFATGADGLIPLTKKHGYAEQYRERPQLEAVADIIQQLQKRRR